MNVACIPVLIENAVSDDLALSSTCGKTLLRHTFEAVCRARTFDQIVIATNNERVVKLTESWACKTYVSSNPLLAQFQLAGEAISHVADNAECIVILSVREPDMPSTYLDRIVRSVNAGIGAVAISGPFDNMTQGHMNPNDGQQIKVVASKQGKALYFTRRKTSGAAKLMGCFGFDRSTMRRIEMMPQSSMALSEKVEPLSWLDNGLQVKVIQMEYSTLSIRDKEELSFWEPPTDQSHVGI